MPTLLHPEGIPRYRLTGVPGGVYLGLRLFSYLEGLAGLLWLGAGLYAALIAPQPPDPAAAGAGTRIMSMFVMALAAMVGFAVCQMVAALVARWRGEPLRVFIRPVGAPPFARTHPTINVVIDEDASPAPAEVPFSLMLLQAMADPGFTIRPGTEQEGGRDARHDV